jgi:hypothetical protein
VMWEGAGGQSAATPAAVAHQSAASPAALAP